jgi:hypothetical protein
MLRFIKLIPALAVIVSLSPLAANALSQHGSQKAYIAATTVSSQIAANSKGRPAEFTPAQSNQVAANSKGRPAEFTPAASNEVAVNSKGRPAEFTPANEVAANSKGRPGEFQVADNSKGRPGETAPQYETPMG